MNILITGIAGFIGYFLAQRLLSEDNQIYGIDNLNNYYDVTLKKARLSHLSLSSNFTFQYLDLADRSEMAKLFQEHSFDCVVNLAAQAGVRYSLENPSAYIDSNLTGFANILEGCRHSQVSHLVFASSSSVYGANKKVPFQVSDNVDFPVSLYAATKKSNELMAHAYSHLYKIPTTGLRFFTVYGPWGRPDMAYFKFVKAIQTNQPIDVYNFGKMKRDFTYIDDIVEGITRVMRKPPQVNIDPDNSSQAAYKIYNIGNNSPVELMHFIEVIEQELGKKAQKNMLPMQAGDVPMTYADVDDLMKDVGFKPSTSIETGIHNFIEWYRDYFKN
ncbi:nucleoside-diphosphate-sugar epimerase [Xenococcus sp. PCC 7305]|uniref:NAD-dependent epimerase n=1 Tax=Xenococcus sp. PCC 7305 TaxID=102125 RepID=UPI0002ACF5FD|nr:NAD-dependent epimerase [Xenococcus sp. PCC 7305]ELS04635.1 nucleoside-diphosphate-sugar epimerase [Xenococcus sp. PCC 7305]